MRVNPFYVSNLATSLNQAQLMEEQLTTQLSSGVRVNSLSDDPLAAGENVLLLNQMQRDDSFTQTSSLVQGQLQVADSALGSVVAQLTQAVALATAGNNGTMNASDRKAISNQIAGIRDEVLGLANTNYQGQFVFGGSRTANAPFSISSQTTPSIAQYNGDSVVNYLETPNGQKIQLNVPGDQIFTASGTNNVLATLNLLVADFAATTSASDSVADTTALSSALNFVSQQRVVVDNSLIRLTSATEAANSEHSQLTVAQTNLMQADVAKISTQLSMAKTQQTALESVIAQLGGGSLFDKL